MTKKENATGKLKSSRWVCYDAGLFAALPFLAPMFVIYDLETTGLRPDDCEIIQIAAVRFREGRLNHAETFFSYARPALPIPAFIVRYTGVTDRHVAEAPRPHEVLQQFAEFVGADCGLIAHNGHRFDSRFLDATCRRHGLGTRQVHSIDSLHFSRRLFGTARGTGHGMDYPVLDPHSNSREGVVPGACALAMMIKAPRPGASKTRLSPPLTPEEAAALSRCFLRDTTSNIDHVVQAHAPGGGGAPAAGVAVYTPVGLEAAFEGLLPAGFVLVAQRDGTFGERLTGALEDLLTLGYGSVCLIDSDSPTLPAAALAAAVEALAQPGDRAVFGPSEDGGYYLLGLKQAHRRLFEDIEWSTERTGPQTLERAAELGLEVIQLPTWYDVDDRVTLHALCDELFDPASSRAQAGGFPAPCTEGMLAGLLAAEGRKRIWPEA